MPSDGTGAGIDILSLCAPPAWLMMLLRYFVSTGSPRPKMTYTAASAIARGVLVRRSHSRRQVPTGAGGAQVALGRAWLAGSLGGGAPAADRVVIGPPPSAGWSGRGTRTRGRRRPARTRPAGRRTRR